MTGHRNPFEPPKARLDLAGPVAPDGSLEDAVAGRYDFTIDGVMSEAWGLVKGFKGAFWGAALIINAGFLVLAMIASGAVVGPESNPILPAVIQGLLGVLMMPLFVGLMAMGVRRAAGLPVTFSMAFAYLNRAPSLIVAGLLVTVLTYVGFFLLIVPGIYVSIAYGMTLPLIAFHDLKPWAAMEASRKATAHKWWRVFGLYLVVGLLVALSALPFGIPLIWTYPWLILVTGVLYRRVFGIPAGSATARVLQGA